MDVGQVVRRKRNPNVQRVLMPYFILLFLIEGLDFIHDSFKQLPLYLKIYLLVTNTISLVHKIGIIIMVILNFTSITMDLGLVSSLISLLIVVLNSLAVHAVFYLKWPQVRKTLDQLNDISTDIIDDNSVFHKKALVSQRCNLFSIFALSIFMLTMSFRKTSDLHIDDWIFNNASIYFNGCLNRPRALDYLYWPIPIYCVLSHFLFVGLFIILTMYVQANFECLRQKCLSDIRELNAGSPSSTFSSKRTMDKTSTWEAGRTEKNDQRRHREMQHPVWALLRRHQGLCQLVTLMDEIFREATIIWTFSELTAIIFMIRALDIGVAANDNFYDMLASITIFVVVFVSKLMHAGAVNEQVGEIVITC